MECNYPRTLSKNYNIITVPCGKCIACRINRTTMWTNRLLHELGEWKEGSSFVTLTYDEDYLPGNNSLVKSDLQKFFKRLRKDLDLEDRKIKYYACGEYGEKYGRPHYHAIIYGLPIDDQELIKENWPYGMIKVGTVTQHSCRYVAGYIQKKYGGDLAKEKYGDNQPPFQLQSQGLGLNWALKNRNNLQKNGYITSQGKKFPVPKYYVKKLDIVIDNDKTNKEIIEKSEKLEKYINKNNKKITDKITVIEEKRKQNDLEIKTRTSIYENKKL